MNESLALSWGTWSAVLLGMLWIPGWVGLGTPAGSWLMAVSGLLAGLVLVPETWRCHRRQVFARPLWLDSDILLSPDLSSQRDMLLGYGASWGRREAQRLHRFLVAGPEPRQPPGLLGFAGRARALRMDADPGSGHILVMGAPGTGKTQLFKLLALQAIARGEAVILLDPKGGGLRRSLSHAAAKAGRPFFQLLPAEPEHSDRMDLLANGHQASELASRLCHLLAPDESGNAFGQFAWMTLNRILEALLVAHLPVHLRGLRHHVSDQGQTLYRQLLAQGQPALSEPMQGLKLLVGHPPEHYRKMVLALSPVLETLTSGALGHLLSPPFPEACEADTGGCPQVRLDQVIRQGGVLYAGLGALTDAAGARALGGLLLADLAAVAGNRYRREGASAAVQVFVDEASEMTNPAFVQLLNKGRECGFRVTFAVQTLADLEVAMGGTGPARMMVGNAGHLIAFRTLDAGSRVAWSERAGTVWLRSASRSLSAQRTATSLGHQRGVAAGRGEQELELPLVPEALLGHLPDLQFVGLLNGKRVVVGKLPLIAGEG